jgi:hypothetical protein
MSACFVAIFRGNAVILSAIDRIRLDKAAVDEGFGLKRGEPDGWLAYGSIDAPSELLLTRGSDGFVAATNHIGVAADLRASWPVWHGHAPPGFTAFVVQDTMPLHNLVRSIWRLARSLPKEPLRVFEARTSALPRSTEAERLVVQRLGQDIFRDALMEYWGAACAVLGVREPRLLRASHIRPWSECETDAERLDVYNGLLLAAHLDAAFDAFLISFNDDGAIVLSDALSASDRASLGINPSLRLSKVAPAHHSRLAWHRNRLCQVTST